MSTPLLELEGAWEEIAAHATEFAGRRVRLSVLESESDSSDAIDLRTHGIDPMQAAELRGRLTTFAAD